MASTIASAAGPAQDFRGEVCRDLGISRHLFTRPYGPAPTARIELFIQTLTNRWAYGAIYGSSTERTAALPGWLTH